MKIRSQIRMAGLIIMAVPYSTVALCQQTDSFNDIYKLCEAKKYKEAIPKLLAYVSVNPKHVASHYELGKGYSYLYDLIVDQQNKNVRLQDKSQWTEQDYQDNLKMWQGGMNYTDSAIYFYKEASERLNIGFLTGNLKYPEISQAIQNCNVITEVKCARKYIADVVDKLESINATNKANYFTAKKDYDAFEKNQQSTPNPQYTGTFNTVMQGSGHFHSSLKISISGSQYVGVWHDASGDMVTVKNLIINISTNDISFTVSTQTDNLNAGEYRGKFIIDGQKVTISFDNLILKNELW